MYREIPYVLSFWLERYSLRLALEDYGMSEIYERDIIVQLWMIKAAPLPCYEGNQQVKIGELTKLNQSHQAK